MNNIDEIYVKEQDFTDFMSEKVLPFMKENIIKEYFNATDGARLACQYLINPNEKGAIAISHGYCEFASKYYELMYYFYHDFTLTHFL